jgi:hypothetical protein
MSTADFMLALFSFFNFLRVFSYIPQIIRVARDTNGASAISYSTWVTWTCANASTLGYAAVNLHDPWLALISGINTTGCATVITLTMIKRRQYRGRFEAA